MPGVPPALSADGKLILLTKNTSVKSQRLIEWPLSDLPFYFPVVPESISYSKTPTFSDQQVVKRGLVSQFGGPGLLSISWSGEFVDEDYLAADGGGTYVMSPPSGLRLYGAHEAKVLLRALSDNGLVVNLSIQDRATGRIEEALPVTIREFSTSENGGEPDTRFYSIQFTEHRSIRLRNVPRAGLPFWDPLRPGADVEGRYVKNPYVLPRRMGIQTVALAAYHNKSYWKDIVKANGGTSGMLKKGCTRNVKAASGPWICPKNTRLFIPNLPLKPSR
jgi:hypothetical protein